VRASVLAVAALAIAAAGNGCAYSTNAALLAPHLKTVAIPVFINETAEYTLDREITDAVIARFVGNNALKIVDERSADAVVRGRVVSYRNAVFGFSRENRAEEYRVTITVAVTFKDNVKNREIWTDAALTKTANYYVVSVPGQDAKTELDGRQEAVTRIADEVLSRSVESW
jgi:hypothetical protein